VQKVSGTLIPSIYPVYPGRSGQYQLAVHPSAIYDILRAASPARAILAYTTVTHLCTNSMTLNITNARAQAFSTTCKAGSRLALVCSTGLRHSPMRRGWGIRMGRAAALALPDKDW